MNAQKARVLHAIPGRVRLRLTADEALGPSAASHLDRLARELVKCPQVVAVSPRPLTGSLVVMHQGNFEAVARFARERGLFDAGPARPVPKTVLGQIGAQVSRADERVREHSDGRVGLDTVGFYALLAMGGIQILRGNFMPAAAALLLNAATWVPHESTPGSAPVP